MSSSGTRRIKYLKMHPVDSQWDYTIDLRIHVRAKSAEAAVEKVEKLCETITRKVGWAMLVINRWEGK
jgi:hypothetical protein